jgi:arginyl-tRNA synthetase
LYSIGPVTPKDTAQLIAAAVEYPSLLVESTTTAPNGFVNIFVSRSAVLAHMKRVLTEGTRTTVAAPTPRRVLVDFSSPNIAKEMHVGHLRSTIIGDAICRILEFCGHDVARVNHVGDWGMHSLITMLHT